jgi:enamine deaminase RidA (YjgF/YER057c/UK114 family)
VRRDVFREPFPASVGVQVVGLVHEGALIELEAVAELGQAPSHGGRTTAQA